MNNPQVSIIAISSRINFSNTYANGNSIVHLDKLSRTNEEYWAQRSVDIEFVRANSRK